MSAGSASVHLAAAGEPPPDQPSRPCGASATWCWRDVLIILRTEQSRRPGRARFPQHGCSKEARPQYKKRRPACSELNENRCRVAQAMVCRPWRRGGKLAASMPLPGPGLSLYQYSETSRTALFLISRHGHCSRRRGGMNALNTGHLPLPATRAAAESGAWSPHRLLSLTQGLPTPSGHPSPPFHPARSSRYRWPAGCLNLQALPLSAPCSTSAHAMWPSGVACKP